MYDLWENELSGKNICLGSVLFSFRTTLRTRTARVFVQIVRFRTGSDTDGATSEKYPSARIVGPSRTAGSRNCSSAISLRIRRPADRDRDASDARTGVFARRQNERELLLFKIVLRDSGPTYPDRLLAGGGGPSAKRRTRRMSWTTR